MNCDHIENLLSAFVDGDLSGADEAAVHQHLASCQSCRDSFAAYRALEDALVMRRDAVPPAEPFLRGVVEPAVTNLHRARVLMDAIFSFPSLASFFCVVLAWGAFVYAGRLAQFLNWVVGEAPIVSRFGGWMAASVNSLTGGDMLVTVVAYAGVTLLILGSGTLMTLRHVYRD